MRGLLGFVAGALLALTCACGPKQPVQTAVTPPLEEEPTVVVSEDTVKVAVESEEIQSERAAEEAFLQEKKIDGEHGDVARIADEHEDGHGHKPNAEMAKWVSDYDIPIVLNDQVDNWLLYFTTRGRPWMTKWLERSGRYEPMMRATLKKYDLPGDLVYLAMIESGFSTRAYSRARAVGPWQFMSYTGAEYGLTSDWWMDMRRDPAQSSDAAARHLKDLYRTFGDWYLAAAAYNAGTGKVRRAVKRYGSRDFFEIAKGRYLRAETKNYVPKLIAAALIAKHPETFGFKDIQYWEPIEYDVVTVPDATGLDVIAKAAGVGVVEVEALNPSLRRFCTPPGRKWEVRVPTGTAEKFTAEFAKIPAKQRVTFRRHVIRRGDTLGAIAARYRTGMAAIKSMNGIRNPRKIRIGQTLVIPIPAYRAPAVAAAIKVARKSGRRAPVAPARPPAGSVKKTHTMRAGETLWAISEQYEVSVRELKNWNGIRNHRRLQAGRKLTVYARPGKKTATLSPTTPTALPAVVKASTRGVVHYTVKSGDNVWDIARRHNADPSEVLELNELSRREARSIYPGQVLKVPKQD